MSFIKQNGKYIEKTSIYRPEEESVPKHKLNIGKNEKLPKSLVDWSIRPKKKYKKKWKMPEG